MRSLWLALGFLTIVPLPAGRAPVSERDLTRSAAAFVLVGGLQGLLLVATDLAAGWLFHPDLALWLVLLVAVLISGGFHLDGLADTFDALAVKSSGDEQADRERRLAAMKDSATGAIGMLAVFFLLLLKFQALKSLSHNSYAAYYSSLLLLPALGKWAMLSVMPVAVPSRPDGLGRLFLGKVGRREILWGAATLLGPLLVPALLLAAYLPPFSWAFYLALPWLLHLWCRWLMVIFQRRFGGLNGDSLGALNELAELLFLLAVLMWLRLSIW